MVTLFIEVEQSFRPVESEYKPAEQSNYMIPNSVTILSPLRLCKASPSEVVQRLGFGTYTQANDVTSEVELSLFDDMDGPRLFFLYLIIKAEQRTTSNTTNDCALSHDSLLN